MKITEQELQSLIKEEAMRLKMRMMLESEKKSILKKLQEIEECDMMESEETGSIASAEINPETIQKVERRTEAIMSHLNPELANKALEELQNAGLLGASEEEIKNKIAEMLPMNESLISEEFNKSKLYNWLIGAGLGATVAGLVSTVIGSLSTAELSNLADFTGATVTPSATVIAGLVTSAIGAISMGAGKYGKENIDNTQNQMDPDTAAKIIAARKLRGLK